MKIIVTYHYCYYCYCYYYYYLFIYLFIEWVIKQLLDSAFEWYGKLCRPLPSLISDLLFGSYSTSSNNCELFTSYLWYSRKSYCHISVRLKAVFKALGVPSEHRGANPQDELDEDQTTPCCARHPTKFEEK